MCTNPRNIRNQLRENGRERSRGDGATTLLQDFSMQMTSREAFFNRVTIASMIFLIGLLLSKQLAWAAYIFDLLKPLYFIYVCMVVVVDFLNPFLQRVENYYLAMIDHFNGDALEESPPVRGPSRSMSVEEYESIAQDVNCLGEEDVNRNMIFDDQLNNNQGPCRFQEEDGGYRKDLVKELKQIKSRRRTGDAHSMILKALESELRKETVVKRQSQSQ